MQSPIFVISAIGKKDRTRRLHLVPGAGIAQGRIYTRSIINGIIVVLQVGTAGRKDPLIGKDA